MCQGLRIFNRLFLQFALILWAGILQVNGQNYHFDKFTSKDGLIQSNARGMLQDSNGYLWIATDGGLSQFDGKKFNSYSTNNGLKQPSVQTICKDQSGNIWFGHTTGNLGYFDGKSFHYPITDSLLLKHRIYHLFCDKEGYIWVSTIGAGVFKISPKNFKVVQQFSEKENLCDEVFRTIQRKNGTIWFVTRIGIKQLNPKNNEITFFKPSGLPFYNYTSMLEDHENNLWFGSEANGLIKYSFSSNTSQQYDFEGGQVSGFVVDLMLSSDSSIWAASWAEGSQAGGLIRVKGKDIRILTKHNGLPGEKAISIFEDKEKNIWTGLFNSGLCKFKGFAFSHLGKEDGLRNTVINSILRQEKNLWVGTDFGLFIYQKNINQSFRLIKEINTLNDLGSNQITSIIEHGDKIIVSTFKGKIGFYNANNFGFEFSILIRKNWINTLAIDQNQLLWIGSADGVTTYNFQQKEFNEVPFFDDKNVLKIFPDSKGRIWFGSREGGGFILDGTEYISFNQIGIKHRSPTTIFQDITGKIWIGTEGGGLYSGAPNNFSKIGIKQGLPSDYINFITSDLGGNLWIGTNKGLGQILAAKNQIKLFQETEGFIFPETINNSVFREENGVLWFGTNNGIIILNTNENNFYTPPPRVLITSFQIYSTNFKINGNHSLSHNQNDITFHFKAIAFKNPYRIKYIYQLKGYDDGVLTSNQENIHYTNLPAGNYTFTVSAITEDGVKNPREATFSFEINPPFWKTKWFIFLLVFTGFVSVYLTIFLRTLNLRRAKEKLEIQVKERTNEIELKNFTLQKANLLISNKNKEITDSINYAKKIQEAILPSKNLLVELFPESFILFKPKDIVSGDFYWFSHLSNQSSLLAGLTGATENVRLLQKPVPEKDLVILAVADCTGHGVPGAFMCMIGTSLLNQIVQENEDSPPSTILTLLNTGIQTALKQTQSETQDGMDIALCIIDRRNKTISFSGAMRPLYIFRKSENENSTFEELKPDKNPIGGIHGRTDKKFTLQTKSYKQGDSIYLFSDGFADQFGGENGKKLMTKKFRELIVSVQHLNMEAQCFYLENFMEKWKNGYDQVDDVLIMGIRF
jgi:ligand-binding sensor domain-containing protein/serine phosphatase RsbU (regulator of sigma subunit)